MKRTIKGIPFDFSNEDVKQTTVAMSPGKRDRVRFYVKVQGQLYPARQLLVEMLRRKGATVPEVTTHEAIRIVRALGFEITELK